MNRVRYEPDAYMHPRCPTVDKLPPAGADVRSADQRRVALPHDWDHVRDAWYRCLFCGLDAKGWRP